MTWASARGLGFAAGVAVLAGAAVAGAPRAGTPITGAAWLAGVAALLLAVFPQVRRSSVACVVAVSAGSVSLAVTVLNDASANNTAGLWWLAELAVSCVTLRLAVRRTPGRAAALGGTVMAAAITALPLRLTLHADPPATTRGAVLGCVLCGVGAALTAATALYPRLLDARRARAVAEARRAQRLDLARDLHDFVAHDVSGMIVQAQAAQIGADPEVARAALRRIEDAGTRAMASLDRTVHMLHEDDGPRRPHGLDDLTGLTERFAESCDARVRLVVDVRDPPHEVSATAYRLVVEALTNVRRHAPDATAVDIAVTEVAVTEVAVTEVAVTEAPGPAVRVRVTDDGHGRRHGRRRARLRLPGLGGHGLGGLAERVGALGGEFAAGPADGGGWQVTALLPLHPRVRSRS
ncbi:two-component sensor histidine kinase [Actinomadura harenae]|uniref:histidine kinase n=1 Tax=Actinomadura harenae TaxID=2483351 RepID=A0A3M2LJU1_9ACTN|nr:two-component sensor histidine kinase [Actinomadura harenae]